MAVTHQKDVGALIAESIDTYYTNHQSAAYWYEWRQRAVKLFESVKLLSESEHRTLLRLFESAADVDLSKDPTYRKGYKSGWKRGRDNPSDNQPPAQHADDSTYTLGFKAGLEASQHGQKLLQHAKSKEEPSTDNPNPPESPFASDEEAGDHFLQNVVFPHFPHVENEKKEYLSQRGQLDKISDEEGEQGRPRAGGRAGDDWDEHGHGWFVGSGMEAPQSFHDMPGFVERMNAAVDTDNESGYNIGKPGKEDDAPFHPADFGRALGVKMSGHANRGAGIQVGEFKKKEKLGQKPEGGDAPDTREVGVGGKHDEARRQALEKLHAELHDNHGLMRAALGNEAVDAHLAHVAGEEGGQHHPLMDEFMQAGHQPHEGGYRKMVEHAHDIWVKNLIGKAREAQAAGHPDLQVSKVTAGGSPTPEWQYPVTDKQGNPVMDTVEDPETGEKVQQQRMGTGGGHFTPAGKADFDPVQFLEHSIRDPFGFKNKHGWQVRAASQLSGLENYSQQTRPKDPNNPLKHTTLHPGAGTLEKRVRSAFDWLHNSEPGSHENEMWHYHYGIAPEGDYVAKRTTKEAKKARAQERAIQRVSARPKAFERTKTRLSPEGRETAERLRGEREAREARYGEATDLIYYMMGLLDEWLEENLGYSEIQRLPIMEALFNRVESNYGNLFEVAH